LEVRFTVTPAVLYRGQRAIARHVPWLRWAAVWMSVGYPLLMIAITVAYHGTVLGALQANWGTIIGFPVLWLVGVPLLQRWSAGRLWRGSPALQGEQVYRFEPTGVQVSTPVSSATITWDAVVRAAETPDFVLLFQSKAAALFIPKSAFGSADGVEQFRRVVRTALGTRAAGLAGVDPSLAAT
jgi:YcxB-like protein